MNKNKVLTKSAICYSKDNILLYSKIIYFYTLKIIYYINYDTTEMNTC